MPHPNLLDGNKTALVVVDIQEGFRNAIRDFAVIASRAATVVRGFASRRLKVVFPNQLVGVGKAVLLENKRTGIRGDFRRRAAR